MIQNVGMFIKIIMDFFAMPIRGKSVFICSPILIALFPVYVGMLNNVAMF